MQDNNFASHIFVICIISEHMDVNLYTYKPVELCFMT